MRWWALAILIASQLYAGFTVGFNVFKYTHVCPKSKNLSRALQGCEVTSGTVSRELIATRWNVSACEFQLNLAREREQKFLETLGHYGIRAKE